ncbi:MAG: ADP-forming succinate--CoA ligase subunit beta [Rhodospirillales bacterium]|nr:ADP-forming succinate--CoA ligase subunit beta [Rhodospirillales bacterium]MCB9964530.1 ADP-forming succinate--CoA ligase subunit beta [Rhodospirillales bacterium]MCB9973803.1 ADP-forming succinate--CoA ligase subunit beta [Rhodospirillales bacterium]MCB9980313.1 ADP-forming succinate--CoA ligase subunit beta [Rhodospirillales bacterium]
MNIHEYQAKELLAKYNVAVPKGIPAMSVEEAVQAAKDLGSSLTVVKAQIHAGGRGAGHFKNNPQGKGGVRLCKTLDEVKAAAEAMMGQVLVTKQTGPEGKEVQRLYVTDGVDIEKEYYCSVLLDRATSRVTLMASTEGGMDIEEVAHNTPEKIHKVAIDPATGIQPFHARKLAFALGLDGAAMKSAVKFFMNLYQCYVDLDASIVEINPMILVGEEIMALDAKFNFDDNALFRHKDIAALRDETEEDEKERKAHEYDLSYVALDGNIGCMVNGAGLAMSTMDIIKLYGGEPANFLDVGGGATAEKVTAAFKIILSDPNVKGVLVNIFGGIMKCDVIAEGVIAAAKEVKLSVPLVVRLEGTNVEKGKDMLNNSGLPIIAANDLADAAEKVVAATKKAAAAAA